MSRINQRVAVGAILGLGALGATAGAQTTKPAPGCAGVQVSDPKGDAVRGGSTPAPADANMDITGVFFTYAGGKMAANLQLADASDTLQDGAAGARWYVSWNAKGADRWVRASRNAPDPTTFAYGHMEETVDGGTLRVTDGEIKGTFHAGPDGVLELPVPAAAGGEKGQVLKSVYADTFEAVPSVNVGVPPSQGFRLLQNDRGPDGTDAFGKSYTVGDCEEPGSGTTNPPADATPVPTPAPPSGGGGGGGTSGPAVVETQPLPVKAAGKGGSARKASKKRKLVLAVSSSSPVKDLVFRVFTGDPAKPKVFASGKLAQLNGKAKVTLKARKLKKGTYSLRIDGRLADGRPAVANGRIKFSK